MMAVPVADYRFDGCNFELTDSMKKDFDDHGYFIVRGLIAEGELQKINKTLTESDLCSHAYGVGDDAGGKSRLTLWSFPGNDVTGMLARCNKIAGTSEKLLGGEVYFYHGKLMMKDSFSGGRHVWHQDYGYWYNNGCLTPDLLTVYIALDKCSKENGCLQVLRGSQKCGRIDHSMVAGQTGMDKERLKHIMDKYERIHVEMEPGDTLFFHSNLVHMADQNKSDKRRWTLLYAYNLRDNNPVYVHHHPQYSYLEKVPDSALKECENYTDMSGKKFLNPSIDKTVRVDDKDDEKQ
ncbi:uncharacterized protein LOC115217558 [Argonauta hians]